MRVAVIGAGPSGLATARNLAARGFEVTGFEVHSDVGGLWDIDSPTSTMYESAHLISSKRTTEFAEFPMSDDLPPYPGHREMRDYFRAYARQFGLYDLYRFETEVTSIVPTGEAWSVTAAAPEEFDAVVIATGTFHHPNLPDFSFAGKLLHSSDYRHPDVFSDQRVLVIGCGNSAADIAVDAVHHARSVDLSVRRGYYFVPKFALGRPIDTIGGRVKLPRPLKQRLEALLLRLLVGRPSDYGLPDPDYRLYEAHPVVNTQILHHLGHGDITPRPDIDHVDGSTVTFGDGSSSDYDIVLAATGYTLDYPFIDRSLLNWRGHAPALYLNTFHPQRDNLFVVGMVEASGLGWEGRNLQARLVAAYLDGLRSGHPAATEMRSTIARSAHRRLTGGYRYLDLERMAFYVAKDAFLARVHAHLRDLEGE